MKYQISNRLHFCTPSYFQLNCSIFMHGWEKSHENENENEKFLGQIPEFSLVTFTNLKLSDDLIWFILIIPPHGVYTVKCWKWFISLLLYIWICLVLSWWFTVLFWRNVWCRLFIFYHSTGLTVLAGGV